ncbi:TonB-dependent receptor [Granulicella arctica]|uniref:TonB-dependent transporter Oar-like beta-barrel domain-containing protein n=1 Tax=Granulicella arctica TaxID=940613 RepID=A0A7Y9PHL5_9BACT|nr:carboxypeptidase-like regulatory domain-containing protein [Granulicella arctica]NYF79904.1 hypothetical protein [Granulicella arctica]
MSFSSLRPGISLLNLKRYYIAAIASIVFFSSAAAIAQIPTSSLAGTVQDSTAGVIPNAAVVLTNITSGDTRTGTTNGSGFFTFSSLPSGDYKIAISAAGFGKFVESGIHLDPGDSRALNQIHLGVDAADTITVTSDSQQIDTTSGEVSSLITAKDIEKLAVEGRDVTELFKILPGFAIAGQGVNNTAYDPSQVQVNSALGSYAANGAPISGISLKWDGANITDIGNYGAAIQNVNYDMVSEVKVQSANFTADMSNGPVNINAVTKAGGIDFHGALYTYARTSGLNATDSLAKELGYVKPPDRHIYPGFNIGGPVTIPGTHFNRNGKVTFFAGAEDYAQRNNYAYGSAASAIVHALVPTAAMRAGDFSSTQLSQYLGSSLTSSSYNNINQIPTVNKNGVAVANGNVASTIDAGGAALLNSLPLPNVASNGSYNYITQNLINNDLYQVVGRVDVAFSDKYKFFARYSGERGGNGVPQIPYYSPSSTIGSVNTPGGGMLSTINSQSAAMNLTMILSPTMTNEVFASFAYLNQGFDARNHSALLKTTYNYPYAGAYSANGSVDMPQLQDYGVDGLPLALYPDVSYGPIYAKKLAPNGGDNFTKVFGTHTVKAGVYIERATNNQRVPFGTTNGALSSYYIGSSITDVDGTTYASGGNYLANALQGIFGGYSQQNILPNNNLFFWNIDGYATDSWKIRNNFTLNYGLRIEHLGTWNDKHGVGIAIFDPTTLNLAENDTTRPLPGFRWHATDPSVPVSGVASRPAFFEPRIGFSWDVTSKGQTVVRGGYGQYRYHDSYNDVTNAASSAAGLRSSSISGSGGVTLLGISKQNLSLSTGALNTATTYGLTPGDDEAALTTTYSLAVDQILPYKTQLEIIYIGNNSNYLLNDGSSNTVNLDNVNALPIGALFAPAAGTSVKETPYNAANLATALINARRPYGSTPYNASTGTLGTSPYGSITNYGAIDITKHNTTANYNSIQVAIARQSGNLRYGANYTFGKALGILGSVGNGNAIDPTNLQSNYGVATFDRSQIFNVNYSYMIGNPIKSRFLGALTNGWEVSGITQLQSGVNLQIANGQPNFNPSIQLTGAAYTDGKSTFASVGSIGLLGTPDVTLMPTLTCNPRSKTGGRQFINGSCFALPAQGTNGPNFYPYMHGPAYFNSDLSAQKGFHLGSTRELQFRAAAFNFINHPLVTFNSIRSAEYNNLSFTGTTPSTAVVDPNATSGQTFGYASLTSGRRIMELSAKFVF